LKLVSAFRATECHVIYIPNYKAVLNSVTERPRNHILCPVSCLHSSLTSRSLLHMILAEADYASRDLMQCGSRD